MPRVPQQPSLSPLGRLLRSRLAWAILLAVLLGLLALALLLGPRLRAGNAERRLPGLSVLLITIDTLRADHLGCYADTAPATPALDRLATEGVLFSRCYSQTPLTLPAHTTLLSGTYPPYHQVRDNGGFVVPKTLRLLPEVFRERGYATSAFVAAYVLHSKWGLARGFDHYGDRFDLNRSPDLSLSSIQRPASEVLTEARGWLAGIGDRPFFSWIHLYDPHAPYKPPPPFDALYRHRPYAGEVASVDRELGSFFDFLRRQGLWDRLLVVVTGDHGEMLGEHGEETHGYFIYDSAVHVPLIVRAPFPFPVKRIDPPVEHADLLPTLLDALKLPIPQGNQGQSMVPLLLGKGDAGFQSAYTESWYPRLHFGWAELKGRYRGDWKIIDAPQPELYRWPDDRKEGDNLFWKRAVAAKQEREGLAAQLARMERGALAPVTFREEDRESMDKLAALGYLTGPVDTRGQTSRIDPKAKLEIYVDLTRAKALSGEDRLPEALALVEKLLAADDGVVDAHLLRGNLLYKQQRFSAALDSYRKVLELRPDYNFAMLNLLNTLKNLGDIGKLESEIRGFMKVFPQDAMLHFELGEARFLRKDYPGALPSFERAVALDPMLSRAWNRIGEVYFLRRDYEKAGAAYRQAATVSPAQKRTHFDLALLAEAAGRPAEAEAEYRQELALAPQAFQAAYNLAELLRARGRGDEAAPFYRQAAEGNPRFNIPLFMLAKHLFDRRLDLDEAVRLCERGVAIKPPDRYTALGHYILADISSFRGDRATARRHLERGRQLEDRFPKKR